jgi:hypothetical protein
MSSGLLKFLYGLGGLGLSAGASYLGSELANRNSRSPSSTPPGSPLPPGSVDPNTGAPPPFVPPGNNPYPPGGQTPYESPPIPAPAGNQDIGQLEAVIRLLNKNTQQEARENRAFYPQRTAIDFADFEKREAIARANTLARQRELTSRQTELATINAWQKITEANINRDTQLAYGMMNLSATLGMPNPNVLTALSPVTQQAIAAFKPGTPV